MSLSVYIRKAAENGKVVFPGQYCLNCSDHTVDGDLVSGRELMCAQCHCMKPVRGSQVELATCKSHKVKCLECLRKSKSAHSFSSQYMNDPIDSDSVEFKSEWLQHFKYDADITNLLLSSAGIMSIDPAVGMSTVNDYTGIVITKVLPGNIVYVLEALQKRLSPPQLIDEVFKLRKAYNITKVLLETTSSQLVFMSAFKQEMVKRHEFFTIDEVGRSTKETKAMRIRGLIPFYSNGLVKHRTGLTDLEYQMIQFPRNTHDDIIDALAHQVPYWKGGHEKHHVKNKAPYGSLNWWKKQTGNKKSDRWNNLFGDLIQ